VQFGVVLRRPHSVCGPAQPPVMYDGKAIRRPGGRDSMARCAVKKLLGADHGVLRKIGRRRKKLFLVLSGGPPMLCPPNMGMTRVTVEPAQHSCFGVH